jgi:hypothetical protein
MVGFALLSTPIQEPCYLRYQYFDQGIHLVESNGTFSPSS